MHLRPAAHDGRSHQRPREKNRFLHVETVINLTKVTRRTHSESHKNVYAEIGGEKIRDGCTVLLYRPFFVAEGLPKAWRLAHCRVGHR